MDLTATKVIKTATVNAVYNSAQLTSNPLQVSLVRAPFTPSPTLVLTDLTLANFLGSDPAPSGGAAQQIGCRTGDGADTIFWFGDPAFFWGTASALNLPQTIYGWVAYGIVTPTVYASGLFPNPVVFTTYPQFFYFKDSEWVFLPTFMN